MLQVVPLERFDDRVRMSDEVEKVRGRAEPPRLLEEGDARSIQRGFVHQAAGRGHLAKHVVHLFHREIASDPLSQPRFAPVGILAPEMHHRFRKPHAKIASHGTRGDRTEPPLAFRHGTEREQVQLGRAE